MSDSTSSRPLKSILKKSPISKTTASSSSPLSQNEIKNDSELSYPQYPRDPSPTVPGPSPSSPSPKTTALVSSLLSNSLFSSFLFQVQQMLCETKVSPVVLKRSSLLLRAEDFQCVINERNVMGLCGWPGCENAENPLRDNGSGKDSRSPKFRLSLSRHQVLSSSPPPFCSLKCGENSLKFQLNLQDEPTAWRKWKINSKNNISNTNTHTSTISDNNNNTIIHHDKEQKDQDEDQGHDNMSSPSPSSSTAPPSSSSIIPSVITPTPTPIPPPSSSPSPSPINVTLHEFSYPTVDLRESVIQSTRLFLNNLPKNIVERKTHEEDNNTNGNHDIENKNIISESSSSVIPSDRKEKESKSTEKKTKSKSKSKAKKVPTPSPIANEEDEDDGEALSMKVIERESPLPPHPSNPISISSSSSSSPSLSLNSPFSIEGYVPGSAKQMKHLHSNKDKEKSKSSSPSLLSSSNENSNFSLPPPSTISPILSSTVDSLLSNKIDNNEIFSSSSSSPTPSSSDIIEPHEMLFLCTDEDGMDAADDHKFDEDHGDISLENGNDINISTIVSHNPSSSSVSSQQAKSSKSLSNQFHGMEDSDFIPMKRLNHSVASASSSPSSSLDFSSLSIDDQIDFLAGIALKNKIENENHKSENGREKSKENPMEQKDIKTNISANSSSSSSSSNGKIKRRGKSNSSAASSPSSPPVSVSSPSPLNGNENIPISSSPSTDLEKSSAKQESSPLPSVSSSLKSQSPPSSSPSPSVDLSLDSGNIQSRMPPSVFSSLKSSALSSLSPFATVSSLLLHWVSDDTKRLFITDSSSSSSPSLSSSPCYSFSDRPIERQRQESLLSILNHCQSNVELHFGKFGNSFSPFLISLVCSFHLNEQIPHMKGEYTKALVVAMGRAMKEKEKWERQGGSKESASTSSNYTNEQLEVLSSWGFKSYHIDELVQLLKN